MEKEGIFTDVRLAKYFTACMAVDEFFGCTSKIRSAASQDILSDGGSYKLLINESGR